MKFKIFLIITTIAIFALTGVYFMLAGSNKLTETDIKQVAVAETKTIENTDSKVEEISDKFTLVKELGDVFYKLPNSSEFVKLETPEIKLSFDTTVKTSKEGQAHVLFPNNSVMSIDFDSEVKVQGDENKTEIFQVLGRTWHRIQTLTKEQSYQVKTETAIAAVRGTKFDVNLKKDTLGKVASEISLLEGKIDCHQLTKEGDDYVSKANQLIEAGKTVTLKDFTVDKAWNKREIPKSILNEEFATKMQKMDKEYDASVTETDNTDKLQEILKQKMKGEVKGISTIRDDLDANDSDVNSSNSRLNSISNKISTPTPTPTSTKSDTEDESEEDKEEKDRKNDDEDPDISFNFRSGRESIFETNPKLSVTFRDNQKLVSAKLKILSNDRKFIFAEHKCDKARNNSKYTCEYIWNLSDPVTAKYFETLTTDETEFILEASAEDNSKYKKNTNTKTAYRSFYVRQIKKVQDLKVSANFKESIGSLDFGSDYTVIPVVLTQANNVDSSVQIQLGEISYFSDALQSRITDFNSTNTDSEFIFGDSKVYDLVFKANEIEPIEPFVISNSVNENKNIKSIQFKLSDPKNVLIGDNSTFTLILN